MRSKRRRTEVLDRVSAAVTPVLAGVGALTLTALVLSFFASKTDMGDSALSAMSGIALAAGCFAAAYRTARIRREGGLSSGLICGMAAFAAVMLAGALTVRVFSAGGILIKLVIILAASAAGGICGVNSKPYFK